MNSFNTFAGIRFVENPNLVEDGDPIEVPRTWMERLFSYPWKPWKKVKTVIPKVPSSRVLVMGNVAVAHPEVIKQLRLTNT